MKKVFTFLALTILTASSYAQSILTVFSDDGDKFTLFVDGEKINDFPQSRVADFKSNNDFVSIRIKFDDSSIADIKKKATLKDFDGNDCKVTYKIRQKKGKYKLKGVNFEVITGNNSGASNNSTQEETYQTSSSDSETALPENETSNSSPVSETSNTSNNQIPTSTITASSSASNSSKVKLAYKWIAGKTYRFKANQVDDVTLKVMGINKTDEFTTNTVFALKVNNILSNGTAEGTLYIEEFKVSDSKGASLASLKDIPDAALKSIVEVDVKGNFTFKKIVYMIVNGDEGTILVSADTKDGKVSGSAQVGNQKMIIHAEFDPKSGTLKAGYSMETVKKPATKTIKVKEDAHRIDVLPLQFLDMLVLPEGDVYPESTTSIKMMEYVFTTKTQEISNNIATLDLNIKTDRSDGSSTGMMNGMMNDMDMGGMSGATPKTDLSGDISYNFDINNGIFDSLSGTLNNKMTGMGLDMKVTSKLSLTLVD